MLIQVNTHSSLADVRGNLVVWASGELERALDRFSTRLSRVEVYLSDENQHKESDNDKRCSIEAKMDGFPVMATVHQAATIGEALFGATDKLEKMLDKKLEKQQNHKGNTPFGGEPFAEYDSSPDESEDLAVNDLEAIKAKL